MFKQKLRELYKKKRAELSVAEKDRLNRGLLQQLKQIDWDGIEFLHVFLPIVSMHEPDTRVFVEWAWERIPKINIVVSKTDTQQVRLTHHLYKPDSLLRLNSWGIPEVQNGVEVKESKIDAVLIPMLVCDVKGNRVGYGKGYYDRFLSSCRADVMTIGVSFFPPILSINDVSSYDIPLQKCVTPQRTYVFAENYL